MGYRVSPGIGRRKNPGLHKECYGPGIAAPALSHTSTLGVKMIIARLVVTGVLAGLAGYSAPAKADPVLLRCEKYQDNTTGPSVVFAKVDPEKNDVFLKAHFDQAWKVFKDVKHADDMIQINEKSWVDRSTGVLKWDFATYQCQAARPRVF
jgi:hypothetical protein